MYSIDKTLLDACVLALLQEEDTYGYKLTQEIKNKLQVSESTLYPVLRRLLKSGFLETYDMPSAGRNRRYYKLTEIGRKQCEENKLKWKEYKDVIDSILYGEEN